MKMREGCATRNIPDKPMPLFDKAVPAHHVSDPVTSAIAEKKMNKSGKRQRQCEIVLGLFKHHNGFTSAELAHIGGLDRYMVARRLSDLVKTKQIQEPQKDKMRECGITKSLCVTWWRNEVKK